MATTASATFQPQHAYNVVKVMAQSGDERDSIMGKSKYSNLSPEQEARIKEIRSRLESRKELIQHGIAFVMVNILLWGIWISAGADGFPWPLVVTLGWSIGLVMHGVEVYFDKAVEKTIQRELGFVPTKAKHNGNPGEAYVRLGTDGEVETIEPEMMQGASETEESQ